MFQRFLSRLPVVALAIAVTMLTFVPSECQAWGRCGYGGYGGYGGYYGGYGGYGGWGGYAGYGGYYWPGSYTYNSWYPSYYATTGYWSPYTYSYSYPSYSYPAVTASFAVPSERAAENGRGSYVSTDGNEEASNGAGRVSWPDRESTALIEVQVPANAEIWFNGHKTQQTGPDRFFVTPSLSSDMTSSYDVRAHWMDNGKAVDRKKELKVEPGKRAFVSFSSSSDNTRGSSENTH